MNIYFKSLLISLLTFFIPVYPLLLLVGIFILADTFFGSYAAIKRGERFTSRKLYNIVPKFISYTSSVLLIFLLESFLLSEFISMAFSVDLLMTKLCAMSLIFIESVSLNENIESISGKNIFLGFINILKNVSKLKGKIKDFTD
jgi:hypothetical protein